jgi:hypothetical protein
MYGFKFKYREEVIKHVRGNMWIGRVIGFAITLAETRMYVCQEEGVIEPLIWMAKEEDLVAWGDFSSYEPVPGYTPTTPPK